MDLAMAIIARDEASLGFIKGQDRSIQEGSWEQSSCKRAFCQHCVTFNWDKRSTLQIQHFFFGANSLEGSHEQLFVPSKWFSVNSKIRHKQRVGPQCNWSMRLVIISLLGVWNSFGTHVCDGTLDPIPSFPPWLHNGYPRISDQKGVGRDVALLSWWNMLRPVVWPLQCSVPDNSWQFPTIHDDKNKLLFVLEERCQEIKEF